MKNKKMWIYAVVPLAVAAILIICGVCIWQKQVPFSEQKIELTDVSCDVAGMSVDVDLKQGKGEYPAWNIRITNESSQNASFYIESVDYRNGEKWRQRQLKVDDLLYCWGVYTKEHIDMIKEKNEEFRDSSLDNTVEIAPCPWAEYQFMENTGTYRILIQFEDLDRNELGTACIQWTQA